MDSAAARLKALPTGPRTIFLASSNVADIVSGTARLAELLRAVPAGKLTWEYAPHPELTHATIFNGVGPTALARASVWTTAIY